MQTSASFPTSIFGSLLALGALLFLAIVSHAHLQKADQSTSRQQGSSHIGSILKF